MRIATICLTLVCFAAVPAFASSDPDPQGNDQIAAAVIAMAKASWAAEIKEPTNIPPQFKDHADDYTEFNGDYSTRIDGKAMAMKFAEAGSTSTDLRVAADMANVKVQVYNGDTAILTYNYVGLARDKDGKMTPGRAKSTRVYVKQGANWVLVHANFAPDPLPK
ncbi:MAG: nuclear transport factor 2 family protein [Blastocatellia bacterium]|nr:nuclear transport factor 2 family protein [Blastocatellia bacterium]